VNTAEILGGADLSELQHRVGDVDQFGVDSMVGTRNARPAGWSELAAELARVLDDGLITPVFQPLVDLDTGRVVAYEALARGPQDSPLETPAALFLVAREAGHLAELDWLCRTRALRMALDAGLHEGTGLFLNGEPEALSEPCPPALLGDSVVPPGLRPFIEITERALTARPAELLRAVAQVRDLGWGVALDDVGADIRSLALMPLLSPDVVKLDLRLVHQHPTEEMAEIVNAVLAERERSGVTIVAEGIENEEQLRAARAMGATLGQGWLLGRPAPLPATPVPTAAAPRLLRDAQGGSAATPFATVSPGRDVRHADKRLLVAMSLHLEHQMTRVGPSAIILSAFQDASHFTTKTLRRYEHLARESTFVVALGVGMPARPAPGVRGANLDPSDPLRGEWSVVVLGPHFAGALVAVDLGDTGPDLDRRFDYALTYDRPTVVEAARTLTRRVERLA
jgi:EAL domain-containing protein (putative c-di-GMP-specific phosphodiesterase class I)